MREHVSRKKQTTTGFSIPSLKHPTPSFGLESSAISRQAVSKIQPLHKPVTHDISRVPLRSPQAKLSISQPGDIYEQEADSVAQQVMQRMAQPVNRQSIQREALPEDEEELQMKPLANSITPLVQREALPEDEEELQMKSLDNSTLQREALPEDEEELQMKSLDNSTLQREALPEDEEELQMKSLDNSTLQREALPEDEEELQMKSLDNSTLQREALPEDEEELQMKSLDNSTLQREALPEDEEELQMKPMVQRQAKAGMDAAPDLEASINQARGGGVAIADNIRKPMEVAFGADFSQVKVHTDGQSDQLNQSIQARAFTTGQDVFFRQGEYNPGSRGGQELLAHELTHVVQQNGGAVMRSPLPLEKLPPHLPTETLSTSKGDLVQLAPANWLAPPMSNIVTHPHGWFSTWKKIKALINEYKVLLPADLATRKAKLDEIRPLIAEWEADPKHQASSTEARVIAIRADMATLKTLVATEADEVEGGHSHIRHGADLTDQQLQDRLTTGQDRAGAAANADFSSRFASHELLVSTKNDAVNLLNTARTNTIALFNPLLSDLGNKWITFENTPPGAAKGVAGVARNAARTAVQNAANILNPSPDLLQVTVQNPFAGGAATPAQITNRVINMVQIRQRYRIVINHGQNLGPSFQGTGLHGADPWVSHPGTAPAPAPQSTVTILQPGVMSLLNAPAAAAWPMVTHYPTQAPPPPFGIGF